MTCAKSRTRLSRRFAIRGVPRERRAISLAPVDTIPILSISAARVTINSNSGCL